MNTLLNLILAIAEALASREADHTTPARSVASVWAEKSTVNSRANAAKVATLGRAATLGRVIEVLEHINAAGALAPTEAAAMWGIHTALYGAAPVAAPVTQTRTEENALRPCYGINTSASSANPLCGRNLRRALSETQPLCATHAHQEGAKQNDLLAERAENIAEAARKREEYLASK